MTKTHIRCVRQLSGHGQRGARQPHTHTAVFRVPSGHAVGACLGRAADGAPGAVASPAQCQSRATRGKFGSFQPRTSRTPATAYATVRAERLGNGHRY